jgi:ribosomal protein L16 Arg81 hydroxylase
MLVQVRPGQTPSTLDELIAPLTKAEFLAVLRERRITHLRAANHRYAAWLGWDALRRLIERGEYSQERDHVRVSKESMMVPQTRWETKGTVDNAKLEDFVAKGFSLILTHIEPFVPPLAALCDQIKSRLSEASYAGVIITSGTDGAFKIHFDFEDLVIVQIEGTKRWQFFGPPVPHPVRNMPKPVIPQDSAPIFDEVLEPGDLLIVPAGNWHHCQAGPGRSIHLGVFIIPPTGWDAVRALTANLLAEELFRRPLTRLSSPGDRAALETELKKGILEKVNQLQLDTFLARWCKSVS